MVYYYDCSDTRFLIYMGRDKFENEDLIKYGWPEDIWFHVSNLSSAHVYLRLPPDVTMDTIPEEVLMEVCQLVKQNSIDGSKRDRVPVVYTPWANLKKTKGMDVGQVGFKSEKLCRYERAVEKDKEVVKRIEKSRREVEAPNLAEQRQSRDREIKKKAKREEDEQKLSEKEKREAEQAEKAKRDYKLMMDTSLMRSNKVDVEDVDEYEEDFM